MMKAVGMMGSGKHGKRYSRFPPFPLPLEIALRFPHSHRLDHHGSHFVLDAYTRGYFHELRSHHSVS
jgi:hypothetical protein